MKFFDNLSENIPNQQVSEIVTNIERRINDNYEALTKITTLKKLARTYLQISKDLESLEVHSFFLDYSLIDCSHRLVNDYQNLLLAHFKKITEETQLLNEYAKLPLAYAKEETIDSIKKLIKEKGFSLADVKLHYNDEAYDDGVKSENIDDLNAIEFEDLCMKLLTKHSYIGVEHTTGNSDIDIIAYKDGNKYGINCKCYTNDVDTELVKELATNVNKDDYDFIVLFTNRYFTKAAMEYAASKGISLWNRDTLERLLTD